MSNQCYLRLYESYGFVFYIGHIFNMGNGIYHILSQGQKMFFWLLGTSNAHFLSSILRKPTVLPTPYVPKGTQGN